MPSSVGAVSTALKTALATITGLRTASIQPDQLNPPIAFPVLNSVSYHQSMGTTSALTLMEYTIFVIVGRYTDRTAHATLDSFLSPTGALSVRTALEADQTLGGVVSTLIVDQSTNISSITSAEAEFLQISFNVRVHN
jgi:hypothetical protein